MTSAGSRAWAPLAAHLCRVLGIERGIRVSIAANSLDAVEAATDLARAAIRAGAEIAVEYLPEELDAQLLEHLAPAELRRAPWLSTSALTWADVHVAFRSLHAPRPPSSRPDAAERLAALKEARGRVSALRWEQTRWAIVDVPTRDLAQRLGMGYDDLLAQVLAATAYPSADERAVGMALADRITSAGVARILAADTDLTLGLEGRRGVLFDGTHNIPDGEVATAPVDDRVDGRIAFPGRVEFAGCVFDDLAFEFAGGIAVAATAARGEREANALLDTDAGARRVGELGIGLNPALSTWTGDLLLDEKILGTVHIALGRAYPECGGTNDSALHWDIVKDLRGDAPAGPGTLLLDGVPVIQDGAWIGEGSRLPVDTTDGASTAGHGDEATSALRPARRRPDPRP